MLTYLGYLLVLLGMVAFTISAIGLLRMPDIYSRMHVGAKTPTMGTLLVISGAICLEPSWALKLLLLGAFILLTNPLSSSVIARASHKVGVSHINSKDIDELRDYVEESK
ncbi:Na(+) H(+) antiporter subunit G [hydrothermal vent metagenome]|uniref:Na(+) H(+) antiporter subunit G n=1 Tax=hydrothermal vent metagenome TaxID=652676 RepID=A0A1W1C6C1_9ZZZZ